MTALLLIDLLGTKARWRRGGSNAAVELWEDFADLVTDTAASMDAPDRIVGNVDGDTCVLRCPTVESALALSRRVFRRAWLETRTPQDMRLWLRGIVTSSDNGVTQRSPDEVGAEAETADGPAHKSAGRSAGKAAGSKSAGSKSAAGKSAAGKSPAGKSPAGGDDRAPVAAAAAGQPAAIQGAGFCMMRPDDEVASIHRRVPIPAVQNAYASLRSGYRGMRILVDESLLDDHLRGVFRIPLGRLGVIPFRRMNFTPYPPNLKRSFQDFLWMADGAQDWAQYTMRMKQRMLWSVGDHAEFVQAAATQVVFHETDAILQSVTRKNQMRREERPARARSGHGSEARAEREMGAE